MTDLPQLPVVTGEDAEAVGFARFNGVPHLPIDMTAPRAAARDPGRASRPEETVNGAPPPPPPQPVVLAYGMGVDSTAILIELEARGQAPDLVLTADTGAENPLTYDYYALIRAWMDDRGIAHRMVRYVPKRFKHWPPYYTILENVLTNATLPSISFGRHSCSLKWKVAPQDAFLKEWEPAKAAWARGQKVVRLIGYDAGSADTRRYTHASTLPNDQFESRYPLRDWGWVRAACAARIEAAGLPVPPKSSCFICGAMKPGEVRALPAWCLRLIVLVEARAAPRLRTVEGLWRTSTRTRPGKITDFIRAELLLPAAEIDTIVAQAPLDLVRFQDLAASIPLSERPGIASWLDRFNAQFTQGA